MSESNHPVAVVTGGSRGIGADIVRRFIDAGYQVINLSLEQAEFEHERLRTIITDLSDRGAVQDSAEQIVASCAVTTFVHNAGVIRPDLLENVQLEDLDYLTELHLGSAIRLSQRFLPAMKAAHYGRIVMISSRGVLGLATRTSYAATKAGQIGVVRTWALELAQHGITVNCVAPGPVETDMFSELVPENTPVKQRIIDSLPVRRLGTPADVGRVVLFLCDRESGFITGQIWYVCGGASLGALAL